MKVDIVTKSMWLCKRNLKFIFKGRKFSVNFLSLPSLIHVKSSPSCTIFVPVWFITTCLVFLYISNLLFSGFPQFKVILYGAKVALNYCDWAPLIVMVCFCVTAFQGNVSEQSFHLKEKTLLSDPMETGSPFQFPHSDESHSFTNQTVNLNWHPNVSHQGIILSVRGE